VACGYTLVLAISLWLAYLLRFDFHLPTDEVANMKRLGLFIIPMELFFLFRGRQISGLLSYFDVAEMKLLASGLAQATALQLVVWFVTQGDFMPGRGVILVNGGLAFLLLLALRTGLRHLRLMRQSRTKQRGTGEGVLQVGIVGAGELGGWLARQFNAAGRGRRKVVVFFDDDADKWNMRLCDVPVAGMPECLANGSWQGRLDEVIVAVPGATAERQQQILSILAAANIRARTLPSIDELFSDR
jgi:FlaA1/EpsC-like NDP-sugar epimerase